MGDEAAGRVPLAAARGLRIAPLDDVLCPDCPPGRAAREIALSETFWTNAAYALLPFAIVIVLVVWIVRRIDGRTS